MLYDTQFYRQLHAEGNAWLNQAEAYDLIYIIEDKVPSEKIQVFLTCTEQE